MRDNYQFKNKILILAAGLTGILLVSCGSSRSAYDDDGIYGSEPERTVAVVETQNNSAYYKNYFDNAGSDYDIVEEEEVFTDVEEYSSQRAVEQEPEQATEKQYSVGYSSWEDSGDNVTINVYNNRPFYNNWWNRPYWNTGWNGGWYGGWNVGWYGRPYVGVSWGWGWNNYCPTWYSGYYGPGYYGGGYYYNGYPYYRNTAFINSRRTAYRSGFGNRGYYNRNSIVNRRGNTAYRPRTTARRDEARTRPSTRPQTTRPYSRPQATRPSSRPNARPQTTRPYSRPQSTRPTRPSARPQRPSSRPSARPQRPSSRPSARPQRPSSRPSARPQRPSRPSYSTPRSRPSRPSYSSPRSTPNRSGGGRSGGRRGRM